jgi:hypothetical protein
VSGQYVCHMSRLINADFLRIFKRMTKRRVLILLGYALLAVNFVQNLLVLIDPSASRLRFGDLFSNLQSAHCFKSIGLDVYKSYEEVGGCSYIYGRSYLYFLNFLNLGTQNRLVIGCVQAILVSFIFIFLVKVTLKSNIVGYRFYVAALFSPATLLLLERGNLDGFILILLALATWLLITSKKFLAWAIVSVTVLFKFYTLPLLLLLTFILYKGSKRLILMLGVLLLGGLIYRDIVLTKNNIPSGIFITFGLQSVPNWLNLYFSHQTLTEFRFTFFGGLLLALTIFGSLTLSFNRLIELKKSAAPSIFRIQMPLFIVSSSVFLSCYMAGMNFDYRLPWMVISLFSALPMVKLHRNLGYVLPPVVLLVYWVGTQFGLNNSSRHQSLNVVTQSISDFLILPVASIIFVVLVKVMKNMAFQEKTDFFSTPAASSQ